MATCPHCRRDVIKAKTTRGEVLLDVRLATYSPLRADVVFLTDGVEVGQSLAMVEHRSVCPERAHVLEEERAPGKAAYDAKQAAKQRGAA
jgi:hypothetical protein